MKTVLKYAVTSCLALPARLLWVPTTNVRSNQHQSVQGYYLEE